MTYNWPTPTIDLLLDDERKAVSVLKSEMDFDAFSQPLFWEKIVAQRLGGLATSHKALHDVEVEIWRKTCRAEVKFSRSFLCHFTRIRGKDWSRNIFKWAKPRGCSGKDTVDAVILLGIDSGMVYCWIIPKSDIARNCSSITMTVPAERQGSRSRWDQYAVPFDAMLPAFARVCHNRYDAPMRAKGIRERAQEAVAKAHVGDLFE